LVIAELKRLDTKFHNQALECIHKSVEISNSQDYPPSIIEYQLDEHYTKEWLERVIQSRFFIVALIDGIVTGTGCLHGNEVKTVFVHPDYQRKGVGRLIMEALEGQARRMNYGEIELKSSITGYSFYQKINYRLVEEISEDILGHTVTTYRMKKSL